MISPSTSVSAYSEKDICLRFQLSNTGELVGNLNSEVLGNSCGTVDLGVERAEEQGLGVARVRVGNAECNVLVHDGAQAIL